MLMIDMGVNGGDFDDGLLEEEYVESVPPKFLHSTEKIENINKEFKH